MRDISITSSVSPSHGLFSLDSINTLCVGSKQLHDFAVNRYLYSLALRKSVMSVGYQFSSYIV